MMRVEKDTIPSVLHPLPDIPVNDVLACDFDPPESRLTVFCAYHPPVLIRKLTFSSGSIYFSLRQSSLFRLSG